LERVWSDKRAGGDRLDGVTRIGIDEVAYKKGHKYLIVVVDHDTRRVVWMGEGRSKKALLGFFDALGPERSKAITHVTADAGSWIEAAVAERCPDAIRCLDPFHVVQWATETLDKVRREVWNEARRTAPTNYRGDAQGDAKKLKGARWALWKNPEDLTDRQNDKLDWIAKATPKLWRAYLLKEGLRVIFRSGLQDARAALTKWLAWAQRSRIDAFVELGRTIRTHREAILSSIEHGLSNRPVESVNTKIRLMTRVAYGFKSAQSLISLAMLTLAGDPPILPGRIQPTH
jgi:transposase